MAHGGNVSDALGLWPTNMDNDDFNVPNELFSTGYSLNELETFLNASSIKTKCEFALAHLNTAQILSSITSIANDSDSVTLDELRDFYVVAIMMYSVENTLTLLQMQRIMLVEAVCNLAPDLNAEYVNYMVPDLYKALIFGTGKQRTVKLFDVQSALPVLAIGTSSGKSIALGLLTTALAEYSGTPLEEHSFKSIAKTVEMTYAVPWKVLASEKRYEDMFVVMKTFAMIMASQRGGTDRSERKRLGLEVQKFLIGLRKGMNNLDSYCDFEMMLDRYIWFCSSGGITKP